MINASYTVNVEIKKQDWSFSGGIGLTSHTGLTRWFAFSVQRQFDKEIRQR